MNIAIFWFFWFILWRVAIFIQWQRPIAHEAFERCQHSLFTDAINVYSFPDPNFISVTSFALSFILVEKEMSAPKTSPLHYTMFFGVLTVYSFAEWVLSRAYFYQILLNISVSMMVTLLIVYVVHDLMKYFAEFRYAMRGNVDRSHL